MGTLNTKININTSATSGQVAKYGGTTGQFISGGQKIVTPFLSASIADGTALLITNQCGADGAYVFVENPATNSLNVQLFGYTDVTKAIYNAMGVFEFITDLEPLATLKPGDSTLIPISPTQVGVYAFTTYGTCTINYNISDREAQFGQSGLVVTTVGTTYHYAVLDAQAGVLSQGNPTPYFIANDLAVSSSYFYSTAEIVNGKGYALRLEDPEDQYHVVYKFIDNKGKVAGTLETTSAYTREWQLDGLGGYVVSYQDGSDVIVNIFDGDSLYTHTVEGIFNTSYSLSYAADRDRCSSNGTFAMEIYDYLGNTDDTATIIFNKQNKYVLAVTNATDLTYIYETATSNYSNFFLIVEYNDDAGYYNYAKIFNTSGELLQEFVGPEVDSIDYVFYGSNKLQVIFSSSQVTPNTDFLYNYNGDTDTLIGGDDNWTHSNTGNYDDRYLYAYSKHATDSIREYLSTWTAGIYDAESVAILYSDISQNSGSYHINSTVNYCDIVYVLNGDITPTTYQFANNQEKYIRIPNEYGYDTINPSSNLIAFNYGVRGNATGPLNVLTITQKGVSTSTLASKLQDLNNSNGGIRINPVGEYILHSLYNQVKDKTTHTVVKTASKKDSVEIQGNATGNSYYLLRKNSVLLKSSNYPSPRNWYFNTTIGKFRELTNGGGSFNHDKPRYAQFYYNNSTTTDGLNDGNILLGPDLGEPIGTAYDGNAGLYGYNNNMRLLKKGVVTANVVLPTTTNDAWLLSLGSDAVFFLYADPQDDDRYKLNVYDLDLNLKKSIPLNAYAIDIVDGRVVGKRCYIKTYNTDNLLGNNYYSYYMVSLKGMAYWLHADNDNIIFNDKYWWDFIW